VAEAVEESDEVIARVDVAADSALDGTTVRAADIETATGMRVIAVRRTGGAGHTDTVGDGEYVVSPGPETGLSAGDVLIAKGTRTGAQRLSDLASGGGTATGP
jgi:uncharacterized protein with PhoU and TrkA domain